MPVIINPQVDRYINKAEPFAKPILKKFRELVHQACPEVIETIKWGMPYFDYNGMLCGMASFKNHCAFGFRKAKLMSDDAGIFNDSGMGSLGKIQSIKELPSDQILLKYIKEAAKLNEKNVPLPPVQRKPLPAMPEELEAALDNDLSAKDVFNSMSTSHKREYMEWVAEAKLEATRLKRAQKAVHQLRENKSLNWKYK